VVVIGETLAEPAEELPGTVKFVPVQEVAFVDAHIRTELPPLVMVVGVALSVAVIAPPAGNSAIWQAVPLQQAFKQPRVDAEQVDIVPPRFTTPDAQDTGGEDNVRVPTELLPATLVFPCC
jgi:hypothetical protein